MEEQKGSPVLMMLAQNVLIVLFVLLTGDGECNAEDSDMKLARAQNHFALKLLKELCSEEPESNIFFSPTSISVALAMVYAAARGKSEAEFSTALGHTAAGLPSRESTLESYKKILAEQQTDDNLSLMIANAVFVQKKLKVLKSYRKELVDIFAAMYRSVDVGGGKSAMESEVNQWVKNKTKDQISGFKIPAGTITALLNAINFKGLWETPSDLKYSFSLPFYNKGSEFDLKTEYNLVPALKKLGVGSIFSDADLSGIPGGEGQVVTEVQHKAAIEINEEGTVAAAATAVRTDYDALSFHKGHKFTIKKIMTQPPDGDRCSARLSAGWWFKDCNDGEF
ncbi:intracellular coagulation inhibitor 2-like [Ixodes scapularis]